MKVKFERNFSLLLKRPNVVLALRVGYGTWVCPLKRTQSNETVWSSDSASALAGILHKSKSYLRNIVR
jgi:hypothetical protein